MVSAARGSDDALHAVGAPIGHEHADVTGGWLRPAVFGVMDGLVSNFALIAGVSGAGALPRTVALTGLAGLVAGAFSMAAGEYVSVASQSESAQAELDLERLELQRNPEGERAELAQVYIDRGVDPQLALEVARQMSRDPVDALRVHALEELGVDPAELPSPGPRPVRPSVPLSSARCCRCCRIFSGPATSPPPRSSPWWRCSAPVP